jgi:hypothetical protein
MRLQTEAGGATWLLPNQMIPDSMQDVAPLAAPAGTDTADRRIGVIVVHGIGRQVAGGPLAEFVRAVERSFAVRVAAGSDGVPVLELTDRTVRFYEGYWADLLPLEAVRGSFNFDVIPAMVFFPWLNLRHGLYPERLFSGWHILGWSLLLAPIGIASLFLFFGGQLLHTMMAGVAESWRRGRGPRQPDKPDIPDGDGAVLRAAREGREQAEAYNRLLDEFAGDVVNYVAACAGALPPSSKLSADVASHIRLRVHGAWQAALRDGCTEVQFVAHSLGSVITYHVLTGFGLPAAGPGEPPPGTEVCRLWNSLTRLYTIGSPLEKILYFWPGIIGRAPAEEIAWIGEACCSLQARGGTARRDRFAWHNFRHRWDPVAGRLRHYDHWAGVRNHTLLHGGGFFTSHVAYGGNPDFIKVIGEELVGLTPRRFSFWMRFRQAVQPAVENLLAPVLFVLLSVLGVAAIAIIPAILAFLASLAWRAGGDYDTAAVVSNWVFWTLLALLLFVMLILGPLKAKEEHRRFRDAPGPRPRAQ